MSTYCFCQKHSGNVAAVPDCPDENHAQGQSVRAPIDEVDDNLRQAANSHKHYRRQAQDEGGQVGGAAYAITKRFGPACASRITSDSHCTASLSSTQRRLDLEFSETNQHCREINQLIPARQQQCHTSTVVLFRLHF